MHAQELFEKVTAELVTAIEAGASGWEMPWRRFGQVGLVRSVDGRAYRGLNAWILGSVSVEQAWGPVWATYRAWARHGAQVRRGEHGTRIVLWKQLPTATNDSERAAGDGDDTHGDDAGRGRSGRLLARTFTVFAAEQVDHAPATPTPARFDADEAGRYFAAICATVIEGGDRACYLPASDTIRLPERDRFANGDHWASTAAHEHAHWTGHRSRLGRDLSGRFGDHAYGAEELVAELTAAFWSAQTGLDQAVRDDHARYLGDWLGLLRADTRAIVAVTGHAQRALDYLNTAAGYPSAMPATAS